MSSYKMKHPFRTTSCSRFAWIRACAKADQLRCELMLRTLPPSSLNNSDKKIIDEIKTCWTTNEIAAFCGSINTLVFFQTIGLSQSRCPGVVNSDSLSIDCKFCKHPHTGIKVVLDTETTGTSKLDQVIEIGAYFTYENGQVFKKYSSLLPSTRLSNKFAQRVHKISENTLKSCGVDSLTEFTRLHKMFQNLQKYDGTLVCHNVSFDKRLLSQTMTTFGYNMPEVNTHCTMKQVRQLSSDVRGKNAKNADVYRFIHPNRKVNTEMVHRALYDAYMTMAIYKHFNN
jgi:DNA polymerase III epsilon subunit-like protein